MGNALVRVEFNVRPSPAPIDRANWKTYVTEHPDRLWLVRPTMVHEGNRRFAQSHPADGPGNLGRKFGKTRDLGSPEHAAGEREMLLICGDDAVVRFHAVSILADLPGEITTRDNSDASFVANLATERRW